jgi:predicted ArsR family transcriptional regulator
MDELALNEVNRRYAYWQYMKWWMRREGGPEPSEPCLTAALIADTVPKVDTPRSGGYATYHDVGPERQRHAASVNRALKRLVDEGALHTRPHPAGGRRSACYAPTRMPAATWQYPIVAGLGRPPRNLGAISRSDLKLLSDAWDAAPDATEDPQVREMINAEVQRINAAFEHLPINVEFVDFDPYHSFEHMRDQVASTGTMLIYTGGSETPLWDEVTNWKARAVHDWDHIVKACDFSIEGEAAAFRHAAQCRPQMAPVYMSEIVLQAAIANYRGGFVEQKLVILPPELQRRAEKLRGGLGQSGDARAQVVAMARRGGQDGVTPLEVAEALSISVDDAQKLLVDLWSEDVLEETQMTRWEPGGPMTDRYWGDDPINPAYNWQAHVYVITGHPYRLAGLGQSGQTDYDFEVEGDEWTDAVWKAAEMLFVSEPPMVMVHLASMGYSKDEAMVIIDAARRLNEQMAP